MTAPIPPGVVFAPCHAWRVIARVEPLTTTRRLSGPVRLPRRRTPVAGRLDRPDPVRAPEARRASSSGSPRRPTCPDEKLVALTSVRDGLDPARPGRPRAVDGRGVLLDAGAGAGARLAAARQGEDWRSGRSATGAEGRVNDAQRALLAPAARARRAATCAALRRLEKRGLVTITQRVDRRAPRTNPAADRAVELTAAQAAALAAIEAAPGASHLLHGVTGSGKTEVYLRAAAAALERGEGVIALVPEIALTPQTVARFSARFGDTVALLHSALSRGRALRRVAAAAHRRGADRRRPALGGLRAGRAPRPDRRRRGARRLLQARGRPALRRPPRRRLPRLPVRRAAARRLAPRRARRPSTRMAPRLPAARRRGRRRPRPAARARARHARRPPLAAPRDAAARSAATRKSIVLLNRRGWSNFLTCKTLREGVGVPELRRRARPAPRRARARLPPLRPPRARPDALRRLRLARPSPATARAPSASRPSCAAALDVPVFRLDADTAANKDAVPELLARFPPRPTGLLLGTQMVAKGHDFPDVTLGVVLDADATLRFPDFRAEERTFALIAQLAGRAGRGPRGGRVLVQTNAPDAPSIVAAARHDSRRLPRRRARAPPQPRLPAVRRPDPRRHQRDRGPAPARAAAVRIAEAHRRRPTPSCSARRRCSACATASATSSSSRPPSAPTRSTPPARRSRPRPATAPSGRQLLGRRRPRLRPL